MPPFRKYLSYPHDISHGERPMTEVWVVDLSRTSFNKISVSFFLMLTLSGLLYVTHFQCINKALLSRYLVAFYLARTRALIYRVAQRADVALIDV
jgi:hypothetical protein